MSLSQETPMTVFVDLSLFLRNAKKTNSKWLSIYFSKYTYQIQWWSYSGIFNLQIEQLWALGLLLILSACPFSSSLSVPSIELVIGHFVIYKHTTNPNIKILNAIFSSTRICRNGITINSKITYWMHKVTQLQTKKNFVFGMVRLRLNEKYDKNTKTVVNENTVHQWLIEAKRSITGIITIGKKASSETCLAPPRHGILILSCRVAIRAFFRWWGTPLPVIRLEQTKK